MAVSRQTPHPPGLPPRVPVLGVPIAVTDYGGALDWIDAMVATKTPGTLTAAAVHLVMLAQDDAATREAVAATTLIVADGQPLVWALRLLGHREISARVYGPELMLRSCERAAANGTRLYLYGGRSEGALVALTLNLRTRFPGLRIVGGSAPPHVEGNSWAPFRELTDEEEGALAEEIDSTGAEIVWVGTGQPRQELWMARMRPQLSAPMLIGVGAAFDFHAGLVAQAPGWMGRHGLEWVFRFAHEPRRLWRRYLRYNPRFVASFARQYVSHRGEPSARHAAGDEPPR